MSLNYCIASYIEDCKTNKQSPGFGDFIRGCLALIKYSEKYDYDFYINKDSHEMFLLFSNNKYFINSNDIKIKENRNVLELIPPLSYEDIDNGLKNLFSSKNNFNILTSGLYNYPNNYGPINTNQYNILKKILTPTYSFQNEINNVLQKINVQKYNYNILHIRTSDRLIRYDRFDSKLLRYVLKLINKNNLIKENTVLVTDSNILALELKKRYKLLKYYKTKKIHLGDRYLNNKSLRKESIKNTLIDFFLIYYSKKIDAIQGSGFSMIASLLGKQKYTKYFYDI